MRPIRAVVLRGTTAARLLPDLFCLLGFTVVMPGIASKRFGKSLD